MVVPAEFIERANAMAGNFAKRFEAYKLLSEHLTRLSGDSVAYADGWNDRRIGEAVGLPPTAIAALRSREFGRINRPRLDQDEADRLRHIEARLTKLEMILMHRDPLKIAEAAE